jgi:hypothetical protein
LSDNRRRRTSCCDDKSMYFCMASSLAVEYLAGGAIASVQMYLDLLGLEQ